ncbi:MAG: UvrD-helicase domain-containing protein [Anaerolineae bacterium]|nr:UvrD-helicase domain-containing protein [Anaerolineae bacterium]
MGFTAQQAAAIYTLDKNLVVAAGAGSGKTRVLVERYLELLAQHPDWSLNSIVAITFTREAALEMHNRVRAELENRLHSAPPAQAERWSALLAAMDSARINTIHGLCADLLRANAAEAGIDPGFRVLDEVDRALLLDDVLTDVFQTLPAADPDALALFTHYDHPDIRQALREGDLLARRLPAAPVSASALVQQWQQDWEQHFLGQMAALTRDDAFMAALHWQPPGGHFPAGDKLAEVWAGVQQQQAALFNPDDRPAALAALLFLSDTANINLTGGSSKAWGDKTIVEESRAMLRLIRTTLQDVVKRIGTPPGDLDLQAAEYLLRWYRLVERVQAAFRAAKQAAGVLDFGDLEQFTTDLLRGHEAVRRRYQGSEFKHVLVDEFQDTSATQWELVQYLTAPAEQTMLFVVGDLKQSIYGFRGADVSVFDGVRGQIAAYSHGRALPLSESFRTHPALIDLFNTLFARILVKDPHSPVARYQVAFDDPLQANRTAISFATPLEMLLLTNTDALNAEEMRTWEAWELARWLRQAYADGRSVRDKDSGDTRTRPFTYGDAAILFRSMTHVTLYENALKAAGVPYVTVAGRGYYRRQEVWDILNLLRALHHPADNLALAVALRSPLFAFSDDLLLALRRLRADDTDPASPVLALWPALTALAEGAVPPALPAASLPALRRAGALLLRLRDLAGRVTIAELLRQCLAETGYLAILTGLPDGVRRRRNVEKLLDIADRSGRISPADFAQYLEAMTLAEVREGEATLDADGAVRLMTVHASKGLEFPVVLLADTGSVGRGHSTSLLSTDAEGRLHCKIFDPEQNKLIAPFAAGQAQQLQQEREAAESKRLLYVAATRARDWLIVSGSVKTMKDGTLKSDGWMQQLLSATGITTADDGALLRPGAVGEIRLHVPAYPAADLAAAGETPVPATGWPALEARIAGVTPQRPPLLHPVHIPPERFLGHLAATQLASLGGARHARSDAERAYHRANVRRSTLHDAPASIKAAIRSHDPRVTGRIVGDIVHEAIRYGRFPETTPGLEAILSSYAWQQNIIMPTDTDRAVQEALHLLQTFEGSDVYTWLKAARAAQRPVYPELPFIYRTEKRILHGVLDVLLQQADGTWVVVDYKTGYVAGGGSPAAATDHARRYHLQVGAYASAVYEQIHALPRVYIHYIRYNTTIEIPPAAWQSAIHALETHIGDIVSSRYD